MAAYNVELRKNDGSAFADLFYPKTTWAMVVGKPSTFTPTPHTHDDRYFTETEMANNIISMRNMQVNPNGVPTSNLGTPTVAEMALFQEQFNNKTEFYDITKIVFETYDGTTWTDVSSTITDQNKKRFMGGDIVGNVNIPNLAVKYRITLRATSYVYLNAMYIYWSSQSHSTKVTIWKKHDSGSWEQVTSSSVSVSAWPGHLFLPFPAIPWHPTAPLGSHWHEVRIEFEPTWSSHATYGTYPILLQKLQLWGGYPAGKRTIYSVDENKNTTFPADVYAAGQVLVKTNDSRLSNLREPVSHATTETKYGLGTTASYGHVKTINALTQSSHTNGTALSAYQGYALKTLVDGKASSTHTHGNISNAGAIGSTSGLMVKTTGSGVLTTLAAGTTLQYLRGDGTWGSPSGWRSIKNWGTYLSSNNTTPVAITTTESISSDKRIGIVISASTSSLRPQQIFWINTKNSTSATASGFVLNIVGNDTYSGGIILYQIEFYCQNGVLYMDDANKVTITSGSPAGCSCVSTTDIKVWDVLVSDY